MMTSAKKYMYKIVSTNQEKTFYKNEKNYIMPDQAFTWIEVGCSDDVDDVLL